MKSSQRWSASPAYGIHVAYYITVSHPLTVLQVPPPAPHEVDEEADSALGEDVYESTRICTAMAT